MSGKRKANRQAKEKQEAMSEEEREELRMTLHGLGESIERSGEQRDVATAGCLYGLCLAIDVGAEVELARHILMVDGDEDDAFVSAPLTGGDARGN